MTMIIRNNKVYAGSGGGSGNANIVKVTQAEYDALPESKNNDGVLYAITNGESQSAGEDASAINYTEEDGSKTTVQDKLSELNSNIDKQNKNLQNTNTNISKIKTYVGSDGKLHFVDSEGADTIIPFKKGIVPMTFSKTEAYSTTDTTYFGESYVYSIDNFKSMTISVTNVQTAYNFSVTVSGKKADGTSKTLASKGWNTSSLGSTTVDISEYVTISVHINQTSGSRPAKRYSISFS